jgi:hypothetical protein
MGWGKFIDTAGLFGAYFRITKTDTKADLTFLTGEQLGKAQRTDDHKQKRPE